MFLFLTLLAAVRVSVSKDYYPETKQESLEFGGAERDGPNTRASVVSNEVIYRTTLRKLPVP